MGLIRAVSRDRKQRVFVKDGCLQDVIAAVCEKLQYCSNKQYRMFKEPEGTEIDSSDVLEILSEDARSNKQYLEIMIIPDDCEWISLEEASNKSDESQIVRADLSVEVISDNLVLPEPRVLCSTENSPLPPPLVMTEIAKVLETGLKAISDSMISPECKHRAKKLAVRESFKLVVKFMQDRGLKMTLPLSRHYASAILEYKNRKFKDLFQIKVGESLVTDGLNTFTQQIYNAANYRKGDGDKQKSGKRKRRVMESEDVQDPEGEQSYETDEYGCVAWEPVLEDNETPESQEKIRVEILKLDCDSAEAFSLMRKTYPTQRHVLNRAKPLKTKLPPALLLWPLLKKRNHFFAHCKALFGKNLQEVWNTEIHKRSQKFNDYMAYVWNKEDIRKSTPLTREMKKLLSDKQSACVAFRSSMPNSVAMFPLLVGYMRNKLDLLIQIYEPERSDQEVIREVMCVTHNPVLVIRGASLFEENVTCSVVVGSDLISVNNVVEGILVTFLSYYVFSIQYPSNLGSTMEFLQRFFCLLNPEKGSKRSDKKRFVDDVDSKVIELSDSLMKFQSDWSLHE